MRTFLVGCALTGASAFAVGGAMPAQRVTSSVAAANFATAMPPAAAARFNMQQLQMVTKPLKIGVVGVTGAVGKEIIDVLGNRKFPVETLTLMGSARSAGKSQETPFGSLEIQEFSLETARACDVVFLAVSGDFALEWVDKITADEGPLVIDNSSAFRYDPTVVSIHTPRKRARPRQALQSPSPACLLDKACETPALAVSTSLNSPPLPLLSSALASLALLSSQPLVVPEINADAARKSKKRVIANPNW